jgi:glycosyltransferase involved in cell wall biosynthesis
MNDKPRVSIGIPVYNGENYLEETLDSILAQTFTDFELIISDNASTDRTEEICRAYAARDPRIRYYRNEKNVGAAANYNRTLELARGEYFRWNGHDDLIAPTYLERCVEALDRDPSTVLAYPLTKQIDGQGKPIENTYEDDFNYRSDKAHHRFKLCMDRFFVKFNNDCPQIFALLRTDVLRRTPQHGNYDSADMILLGELILWGKFYEIPEQLFYRRFHPQMAYNANRSQAARNLWFDPANKGKNFILRWKWFREYLAAIRRAPLSRSERLGCYLQMVRWLFIYGFSRMVYDTLLVLRWTLNKPKEWKEPDENTASTPPS